MPRQGEFGLAFGGWEFWPAGWTRLGTSAIPSRYIQDGSVWLPSSRLLSRRYDSTSRDRAARTAHAQANPEDGRSPGLGCALESVDDSRDLGSRLLGDRGLLFLDLGGRALLNHWRRRFAAAALDPVLEAHEALAQSLAQLGQALGAKENEDDQSDDEQVGRLKQFAHGAFLRGALLAHAGIDRQGVDSQDHLAAISRQ
jgi:hypothetical protein